MLQDVLVCCSWNVRGLTDLKVFEIICNLQRYDIDILCIQETHISSTSVREEQGYLIILSGSDTETRSWAGVGIIISPRCRRRIKSYEQVSDRLCSVKLRVKGGVVGLISVYAPHNMRSLEERFRFFTDLDVEYRHCSANMGKYIYGDLNSRIGHQQPGEEEVVGTFTFGRTAAHPVEVPNRDLLMELCQGNSLMIANTFVPGEAADKATYAAPGYTYADPITEHGFNMLDLLVCDAASFDKIRSLFSVKAATLATDHFLMTAVTEFESFHSPATRPKRRSVASMSEQDVGRSFADAFNESVRAETRECDTGGNGQGRCIVAQSGTQGESTVDIL